MLLAGEFDLFRISIRFCFCMNFMNLCGIFQMLDENNQFIQAIVDFQSKGKAHEVLQ